MSTTSWGRWGAEDERGAMNFVGPQQVLQALSEVVEGRIIPLAGGIRSGATHGIVGRAAPSHFMVRDGGDYAAGLPERGFGYSDDIVTLPTHGATHVDALAHIWRDGQMYNGIPSTEVTSRGARRLGIERMPPVFTRGVFLDAAPGGSLEPGERVGATRLTNLLDAAGVRLREGDALLLRTGWGEQIGSGADPSAWPGLDADCAGILVESGVCLIGADNPAVEAFPSGDPGCQVPLHVTLLRGHGVYFCELLDLRGLARAGRSTFLLSLAALPLVGAVGSPVAPFAVI